MAYEYALLGVVEAAVADTSEQTGLSIVVYVAIVALHVSHEAILVALSLASSMLVSLLARSRGYLLPLVLLT